MGTRSVVAVQQGDGWHGRYIHWDGYPSGVGAALIEIVNRDGVEKAIKTLTQDAFGWSGLDPDRKADVVPSLGAERAVSVAGYGEQYANGTEAHDDWVESTGGNWGTEWAYILGPTKVIVLEAVRNDGHATGFFGFNEGAEWTPRGSIAYDDPKAAETLSQIEQGIDVLAKEPAEA